MKISIITATYNSSSTIEDTLLSVAQQNYSNYEHIIIDGRSTDDTLTKVKNAKAKNIQIYSDYDEGIYDAFNKGLAYATGDVVGFLNSDDVFSDKSVLFNIASKFEECNCEAIYGDLVYLRNSNVEKILRYWKSGHFRQKSIKCGWMPPHPTFYMKKELYDRFGGFNTKFQIAGDYEIMLRYLYKYKISLSYIPRVLVKMRHGGKSSGSIKNLTLKTREDFMIMSFYGLNPFYGVFMKISSKLKQYVQSNIGN